MVEKTVTTADAEIKANWNEDCMKTHGRILSGEKKHWCPDWDFLPIDETCGEMEGCTCRI